MIMKFSIIINMVFIMHKRLVLLLLTLSASTIYSSETSHHTITTDAIESPIRFGFGLPIAGAPQWLENKNRLKMHNPFKAFYNHFAKQDPVSTASASVPTVIPEGTLAQSTTPTITRTTEQPAEAPAPISVPEAPKVTSDTNLDTTPSKVTPTNASYREKITKFFNETYGSAATFTKENPYKVAAGIAVTTIVAAYAIYKYKQYKAAKKKKAALLNN